LYDTDGGGHCTVGYGHLVHQGQCGLVSVNMEKEFQAGITEEKAASIFSKDIGEAERSVTQHVTIELTQGQFDALVSLVYNIGPTKFAKSNLLKALNEERWNDAIREWKEFRLSNGKIVNGLVNRRAEEIELFTLDIKN
jgi:GH24 family phage-related lysozyme (muramidase)